jgi:hypothetical protein
VVGLKLLRGHVVHHRKSPRENFFCYKALYMSLPLSILEEDLSVYMKHNRWGFLSFYDSDHGVGVGSCRDWVYKTLEEKGCDSGAVASIELVCMPRVWGYVFNPVSFWLCFDESGDLRFVLSEVRNTYGERHIYVCLRGEGDVIGKGDEMFADKVFYVSPFLSCKGEYRFRFSYGEEKFSAVVIYEEGDGEKVLLTSLSGSFEAYEKGWKLVWESSYYVLRVLVLIFYQALKLRLKRIKFLSKPEQSLDRVTMTRERGDDL